MYTCIYVIVCFPFHIVGIHLNELTINCCVMLGLLPTSQPSEDARLARRQRIVPREDALCRKNLDRPVSVRCKM